MESPLCVVSSWIIRVYTILVWNTISGSSNLDICFYHCLFLTLIFHIKVLINFFFFFFVIIIIVIVVLLSIIYTINLPMVRPRSCRVIYYFEIPTFGRRHQSFGRVNSSRYDPITEQCFSLDCTTISFLSLVLSLSFQFQYLNSSINPFIYVIDLHLRWTFTIN